MLRDAKEILQPFYTNNDRTQISCGVITKNGQRARLAINKFGLDGESENPDWSWFHENVSQEDIDKNTNEYQEELRSKYEQEQAAKQRIKDEELFNMKLEVFEMEEIRQSRDTKMKSKIRRATNPTQVLLYASALLSKEVTNEEEPKPKKVPTKKRAKKTTSKVTLVDTINDDKRDKT